MAVCARGRLRGQSVPRVGREGRGTDYTLACAFLHAQPSAGSVRCGRAGGRRDTHRCTPRWGTAAGCTRCSSSRGPGTRGRTARACGPRQYFGTEEEGRGRTSTRIVAGNIRFSRSTVVKLSLRPKLRIVYRGSPCSPRSSVPHAKEEGGTGAPSRSGSRPSLRRWRSSPGP